MRTHVLVPLMFAAALAGCQEPTSLVIREQETWNGEPLVLDPAHVEENAPVLYDLLEEAHRTGHAETADLEKRMQALGYLQAQAGSNENHFLVEYRGKVFDVGIRTA